MMAKSIKFLPSLNACQVWMFPEFESWKAIALYISVGGRSFCVSHVFLCHNSLGPKCGRLDNSDDLLQDDLLQDGLLQIGSLKNMASQKHSPLSGPEKKRIAWSEFGQPNNDAALERPSQDLSPAQQKLQVQESRKGRKGKTVTIISGFQSKPETLNALLKDLKTFCGAGGTVKEMSIEVQGEHREKIIQKLKQLGYKV